LIVLISEFQDVISKAKLSPGTLSIPRLMSNIGREAFLFTMTSCV
jgi:hypothetical protein